MVPYTPFGSLNGDVDLQRAEIQAREAFHHFPCARKRTPIHIQPDIVAQSHGGDRLRCRLPTCPPSSCDLPERAPGPKVHKALAARKDLADVGCWRCT